MFRRGRIKTVSDDLISTLAVAVLRFAFVLALILVFPRQVTTMN